MKFELLLQMPNVTTGVWRRLGVHVFKGKLTLADMDRIAAAGDAWLKKTPGTFVEMVIIFPSEASMTSDERTKMAGMIKKHESRRAAAATVVLASGIVGAIHRSVLTGLQMIAPPPHPTKVFGAVDEGVRWLTPYVQTTCGADATADGVLAGVDDLCTRFLAGHVEARTG
jgi:hypothetical protein